MGNKSRSIKDLYARAASLIGAFEDIEGVTDLSARHDDYLAAAVPSTLPPGEPPVSDSLRIEIPTTRIERFCETWKITELSLFGSVLREDFRPGSDIDVLVTFAPDARWSLFDLVRMEADLAEILGRKVDLVERKAVEQSENYIRRKHILSTLRPVYVAG